MNVTTTSLDTVAALVILIILVISGFTLLGTAVLMAIGAVFSNRPLVTSWPADQEHSFSPFERRGATASSSAWAVSIIGGVALMVVAIGLYFGIAPERRDVTKDMNMSNLTQRRTAAPPAPKPDTAAPAEAKPDSPAPAEAPAKP